MNASHAVATTAPHRIDSATPRAPEEHLDARVSLSITRGAGTSDGSWWPRTTSLETEMPDLDLAVHALTGARIARASYVVGLWDTAPRVVRTPLGVTKLGWFRNAKWPENVHLSLTDYTVLVLTVIPPATDDERAELLLREIGNAPSTRPGTSPQGETRI